jgi:hypothetical protein
LKPGFLRSLFYLLVEIALATGPLLLAKMILAEIVGNSKYPGREAGRVFQIFKVTLDF